MDVNSLAGSNTWDNNQGAFIQFIHLRIDSRNVKGKKSKCNDAEIGDTFKYLLTFNITVCSETAGPHVHPIFDY